MLRSHNIPNFPSVRRSNDRLGGGGIFDSAPNYKNVPNKNYVIAATANMDTWENHAASEFAEGIGTKESPYIIKTPEQLGLFAKESYKSNLNGKYYALGANIDLAGLLWSPIGCDGCEFDGEFDGGFYTISNMMIIKADNMVGFFFKINGVVKNLIIANGYITGNGNIGAIAGNVEDGGLVENCIVDNVDFYKPSEEEGGSVGGIAGCNYDSIIRNCVYKNGYINCKYAYSISGIVASVGTSNGIIENCVIMNSILQGGTWKRDAIIDRPGYIESNSYSCYANNVLLIDNDGNAKNENIMRGDLASWGGFISLPSINKGYPIPKSLLTLGITSTQTSEDIYNILINLGIK